MSTQVSSQRVRLVMLIAVLMLAALGSFWILEVMRQEKNALPSLISKDEPDYFVEKFNFVRMSPTGQARYNISGSKLTHFPKDDTFIIDKPLLHDLADGQAPMTLHAERAVVDHVKNEIELQRNVQVDRPASAAGAEFHMRTEILRVLPDQDIIKTDQPVEIKLGNSHLNGTGMIANNRTREIQLASKVHGSFPPRPR